MRPTDQGKNPLIVSVAVRYILHQYVPYIHIPLNTPLNSGKNPQSVGHARMKRKKRFYKGSRDDSVTVLAGENKEQS
jgi:hypothetical protein